MLSIQRRARQRLELRSAILNAAGEFILERGYEGFSLRQVAERIGYSATTIYLYFENKDALVAGVIDEGFGRFVQALQAISRSDPIGRLADLGRAYVRFGLENRVYYQLMFMQRSDLLDLGAREHRRSGSFEILVETVQAALDAGAVRSSDPRTQSLVLWAAMHGIVALAIKMPAFDEATVERTTELMLDMLGQGMLR